MKEIPLPNNVIYDLSLFIMIIFMFAVSSVLAVVILNGLNDGFQASDDVAQVSKDEGNDLALKFPGLFDALIVFAFVGIWIFLIVSVSLLDTHPIFFVISIITSVVVFVLAAVFQDVFLQMSEMILLSGTTSSMPMTVWLMNNLIVVIVFVVITTLISLYSKTQGGGYY